MKGKYILMAAGAVLVIGGSLWSPLLASKLQDDRLLGKVNIRETGEEPRRELSLLEKISLYEEGIRASDSDEIRDAVHYEGDQAEGMESGVDVIGVSAQEELERLKELGVLPQTCSTELFLEKGWYQVETFIDQEGNWATLYQMSSPGKESGYFSLAIEKDSGKIVRLYAEKEYIASQNESDPEIQLQMMSEAWGTYLGVEKTKQRRTDEDEHHLDQLLALKGLICDYGSESTLSYAFYLGENTIEIYPVYKDDTSMK